MFSLVRPIDIIELNIAQKVLLNSLRVGTIPKHIAIIMDGNRRYAEIKKLTRKEVYILGFNNMSYMNALCFKLGVQEVTLYMFSIDNFKRLNTDTSDLLDELIPIALNEVIRQSEVYKQLGIRIRVIGKIDMISEEVKPLMERAMSLTKHNNMFTVNLAIAYNFSYEITNAVQTVADKVRNHELSRQQVDEKVLQDNLLQPMHVDLLLRTSGELRFSDFLCWQMKDANVQIYKKFWPEFNFWDFLGMILKYQRY